MLVNLKRAVPLESLGVHHGRGIRAGPFEARWLRESHVCIGRCRV